MSKKILSAALVILMFFSFVACNSNRNGQSDETTAPATSATTRVTTTAPTTAPQTSTTLPTITSATTLRVTEKRTSAPKATVRATATVASEDVLIDRSAYTEELKYGVVRFRAVKTYYTKLQDGTKKTVSEEFSDTYNRLGYRAAYADLLPAAKENRKKYSAFINEVLSIINGYRAEGGLAPLKLNEELTIVACARAEEIAWSGERSHTRPNGSKCFSIMRDAGINSGIAGENIGWVYETAAAVCEAWKESKTHYENIMDERFTETGIGVAADPDEDWKLTWAQLFLSQ